MRFVRFDFNEFRGDPRYGRWVGAAAGQPSWVWQFAAMAAFLTIVVPIVAFLLTAVGVFLLVFLALSLVNWVINLFRGVLGPRDGRRNVRVVTAHGPGQRQH